MGSLQGSWSSSSGCSRMPPSGDFAAQSTGRGMGMWNALRLLPSFPAERAEKGMKEPGWLSLRASELGRVLWSLRYNGSKPLACIRISGAVKAVL